MITCDAHLHTRWSTDSDAAPDAMAEAAVAAGLDTVIVTDHHDIGSPTGTFTVDEARYRQDIAALARRFEGRLRVLTGIELGLQESQSEAVRAFVRDHGDEYDLIIGSTHFVDGEDPWEPSFWDTRPGRTGLDRYFETLAANVRAFDGYDTLGHLDYAVRYALREGRPYREEDYAPLIDEVLRTIIERGTALECNTAGWPSMGRPNPSREVLLRYRQLGGELITVGSDAHAPGRVGGDFDKAKELLISCGFRYYAVYRHHQPILLPL